MNDDPRVISALRSSVILGVIVAVVDAVWRGAATSRVANVAASSRHEWNSLPRQRRQSMVAVALVIAAVTHVALVVFLAEIPAGWLWLVPAGIAASLGGVLWTTAAAGRN